MVMTSGDISTETCKGHWLKTDLVAVENGSYLNTMSFSSLLQKSDKIDGKLREAVKVEGAKLCGNECIYELRTLRTKQNIYLKATNEEGE